MRARVYNKEKNEYYISEVYAEINRAGSWYVVDNIEDKDKVILVSYLDFETAIPYSVNIEFIDYNPFKMEWISLDKSQMHIINDMLVNSKALHYFNGYMQIWEKTNDLLNLLENGVADKSAFGLERISTKLDGWNYIESQSDIERLLKEYEGFHDSVLKEMSYISGDYKDNDGSMKLNEVGSKQVKLIFNSDWAEEIEIVLLSPRICHLVPGEENYLSDLYDASIFIKDCAVYFFDSFMESIPNEYTGTYFKSLGLMWKYIID